MYAHIISKKELHDLPSASGMELVNDIVYIIGDDSKYLFFCSPEGEILGRHELFHHEASEGERIPKKEKPDLEAITSFKNGNDDYLLILGSGSKSNREVCFLVKLANSFKNISSERFSLKEFYASLRENEEITGGRKLNIEAAASVDDTLILFQRGNKSGKNVLLYFNLPQFVSFLKDSSQPIPQPDIHLFSLPSLKGIPAGFSGAGFLPGSDTIIFTASAEDTKSEVDDGKTLGSFLGILNIYDDNSKHIQTSQIMWENGDDYKGKVESVSVINEEKKGVWRVLAVTDDDLGGSDFLTIRFDTNS
ncbi:MAG TPA: hypothetical protein VEC36_01655 [Patescibacteria group bacterium]|nr:hypothetical protein [Patescibacteria group bacterium]